MYDIKHLMSIARDGLSDMVPAVQQAFNDNRDDDKLDKVFGEKPRQRIVLLTIAGLLVGELIARVFPDLVLDNYIINHYVNWSAIVISMAFALLFRRYLFSSDQAREEDFTWLAASLVPAAVCLAVIAFIKQFLAGSIDYIDGAPLWAGLSAILLAVVNAIGVVAALTIAVAALCFSRDWIRALVDLAVQLFVFKILVWVTILVIVDIGIVGPIIAAIIESIFNIQFPSWLAEFFDQLTLTAVLSITYAALIGAVWTVCKKSFGTLLQDGEVKILSTLNSMTKKPKKPKKKKLRKSADKE